MSDQTPADQTPADQTPADQIPEEAGPGRPKRALLDLLRPRATKGHLIGGLLCLGLGFAISVQVQSTQSDSTFATARQDELVGILSDLAQRSERLRGDLRDLEDTKGNLARDVQGETAIEEARRRATTYGLLAGTLPATGPGIELTIGDPRRVKAGVMLDTLQELRDASAEVIQVNDLRVGVDTYFLDSPGGGVEADGRRLEAPYRFLAIGDPHTLTTALNIPGGVMKNLHSAGAAAVITPRQEIAIRAIRSR